MKTEILYRNKKWLKNKYCKEILSTSEIGILCRVYRSTIRKWLCKFNISRRSKSEVTHLKCKNHCNLSKKALNWIEGELLGDGHLHSYSKYSANFTYSSKFLEYIKYVSDTLKLFGIERAGEIYKRYHKDIDCYSYSYVSRVYPELLSLQKKWYPKGKKIIPKDIKLIPLICRQWYIGDGCLRYTKKQNPYITLATCSFSISDIDFLIKQLINLGFKAMKWKFDNIIGISTYSTEDFLNYIGKCPVDCYQYKWALERK